MSADASVRAVRVRVTGRVQGVAFRWHAEQEARRLDVAGWVRNEVDGSVAALVEGSAGVVDEMVAWLRHGPPSASVTDVEVDEVDPSGERSFRVTG